ncbi:MAG: hypothetical protein U0529_22150 [Thermoanaerobaculia bacterium]
MLPPSPQRSSSASDAGPTILRDLRVAVDAALDGGPGNEARSRRAVPRVTGNCPRCAELETRLHVIETSRGWRYLQLVRKVFGRAW